VALTVTMPQLGESVTEGTITQWLKQPGDAVERYESIAEVTTDKVNAEIPSPVAGTMGEHLVPEGTVVPVGGPICKLEGAEVSPEEGLEEAAGEPTAEPVAAAAPAKDVAAKEVVREIPAGDPSATQAPTPLPAASSAPAVQQADSLHLTPAVRMLAREHSVDLAQITGTGINGRITKKDVLQYVQQRDATQPAGGVTARRAEAEATTQSPPPAPAAAPAPQPPRTTGADTLVPLTPMRRSIAEHMTRSVSTSPHAWTMVEVDMTRVARIRSRRREQFKQHHNTDLTFLPFVAKAVIAALREHPTLNATWSDDGVVLRNDVNLGLAVALEDGLVVPVVKQADRLSLAGLALAAADLTERARAGKLRIEDVEGGTFTLNNAGALGTVMSQAIINQPQAAILVMDAIVKRPVVVEDDAIAVRSMMNLCISFDHRINDGLPAARFLRSVKQALESIEDNAALW
jgi:2-oxoisovalerate dehydrogenase E2 component (dihydrolipoyl transacylase)